MKARSITVRGLAILAAAAFLALTLGVASAMAVTTNNKLVVHAGPYQYEYAATSTVTPSLVTAESSVNTAAVSAWVQYIGNTIDRSAINMRVNLNKSKKRVEFTSRIGYKLNRAAAYNMVMAEVTAHMATGIGYNVLTLPTSVYLPKNLGSKVILERLTIGKGAKSHGYGYLYGTNGKLEKAFRTAIGMPKYPTPTGTFRIGRKVKMPTWTNPGGRWGIGMPAHIGPGVNNPLGTRAMYVYSGKRDTGVRLHGVPASENSSIGRAASHGCLRMKRAAVEDLFKRVPVGTTVYIIK